MNNLYLVFTYFVLYVKNVVGG